MIDSAANDLQQLENHDFKIEKNQEDSGLMIDGEHDNPLLEPLRTMFQALSEPTPNCQKMQKDFCHFLSTKHSFIETFNSSDRDIPSDRLAFSQNDARNFFEYIIDQLHDELNINLENRNYSQDLEELMYFFTCSDFENIFKR